MPRPSNPDLRASPPPVLLIHAFCAALWILSIATFWRPLSQLISLSLGDDRYSHLIVIPVISACLLYWNRREIFHAAKYDLRVGIPLALAAVGAGWFLSLRLLSSGAGYRLSVVILLIILAWVAGFVLFYGVRALRPARFPMLFLLLMIPIPSPVMAKIVWVLQVGTSNVVYALFYLTGTPLFRQGFSFELPGLGIVIAEECSSIHSAWALFIVGLLVGHFFLRSFPAKACLTLLTVPIAMLTNSVRIVTIWFLATHINIDFMYGNLHRNGGILFSLISVALLLVSLYGLRRLEGSGERRA